MVVQMLKRCKILADFTEKVLKQDSTIIEEDNFPKKQKFIFFI
jgi:hypothetical protein